MVKVKQFLEDGEEFVWNKKFESKYKAEEAIYEDYDMDFDNGSEETLKYQILDENSNKVIKTIWID